jgi:AcrR family transcriptional regulator
MPTKTLAKGSATRAVNKQRRKERILDCARQIIATQGYDALTLSQLATDAGVTVPTIHNLLGKKSQLIEHLVGDVVSRLGQVLLRQEGDDPILAVQLFTKELISLYAQDEALYKAAFVAGERAKLFEHQSQQGIFMRSLGLAAQVCEKAKINGHLKGEIDTHILAEQLFGCQRLARHDWMNNYIDLNAYKSRVLIGMFSILAADATQEFRDRLIVEIKTLSS